MKIKDPLIVALDTPNMEVVKKLLNELRGLVNYYKVGFELFTAHGWESIELIRKENAKVFLDLKFHDIPNTVAKSAAVAVEHEVDMFNVHTLGGLEMMKATRKMVDERAKKEKAKPIILGVTILTSHNEETLSEELGIKRGMDEQVLHLAKLAQKAGLDGVVCSPREIKMIRSALPKDFVIVTPGIRPKGSSQDDQKRIFTPQDAFQAGSNYLVVGRPITAAANPREEASQILKAFQ